MIDQIKKELAGLDRSPRTLRNFGMLFSGLFGIAAGVMFWKGSSHWPVLAVIAGGLLITGMVYPRALMYPYLAWMALALSMGWIMTRVVLTTVYFVVMTPIGLLLRVIGKDVLDQRTDKSVDSYWKRHDDGPDRERYKRQF